MPYNFGDSNLSTNHLFNQQALFLGCYWRRLVLKISGHTLMNKTTLALERDYEAYSNNRNGNHKGCK